MIGRFLQARGIPLASLMLVRQPVRLAVALAGISFAGILMFMQLGFRCPRTPQETRMHASSRSWSGLMQVPLSVCQGFPG